MSNKLVVNFRLDPKTIGNTIVILVNFIKGFKAMKSRCTLARLNLVELNEKGALIKILITTALAYTASWLVIACLITMQLSQRWLA